MIESDQDTPVNYLNTAMRVKPQGATPVHLINSLHCAALSLAFLL